MTLLTAIFAAVITTVIWYKKAPDNTMRLGILSLMYWGASIMWFVDFIYEFTENGAEYFNQAPEEMLNDFYLGISVVALGLIIWLIILLIKDPKGVFKEMLFKKKADI